MLTSLNSLFNTYIHKEEGTDGPGQSDLLVTGCRSSIPNIKPEMKITYILKHAQFKGVDILFPYLFDQLSEYESFWYVDFH